MTRISRSGEEEIVKPVSERERPAVLSLFLISIRWVSEIGIRKTCCLSNP